MRLADLGTTRNRRQGSITSAIERHSGKHMLGVRFSRVDPKRDAAHRSLDHLVGAGEHGLWYLEAERC
jgi:hypothetical protein